MVIYEQAKYLQTVTAFSLTLMEKIVLKKTRPI